MTWMVIRASGFVAVAMLSGATIWGLIVSSGLLGRAVSAKRLTYMHESLSVSAILATAVHIAAVYLDEFIVFTPRQLFVPGAATWEPVAVSMGIMAMYGLVLVTASFYIRKWLGQKAWRALHYITFGVFVAAITHGIVAGSDSQSAAATAFYTAIVATVIGLVVVRTVRIKDQAPPRRAPARPQGGRSPSPKQPSPSTERA